MQIQLLRGVALNVGGSPVPLRSERVRSLLAALAWRPGQLLTDASAVEQIWGDDHPLHPQASLYTCASRLRMALGCSRSSVGGGLIRHGGGYALTVDAQAVDMHRFRSLIAKGHAAKRAGAFREALQRFDEGLGLWAGEPLADLRTDWAKRSRITLNRERLSARIVRAEVALVLGRSKEELPALLLLADQHPLNEDIAGLVMVAYSKSGRIAEALEHFARIRKQMRSELGEDLGEPLTELQARILRREPSVEHRMAPVV